MYRGETSRVISVLTPQVESLIKYKAKAVYNVPMERADIEQELRAAIVDYCNKTPEDDRKMSAVAVIINQKLFKLIRDHVKFEGCSPKSRRVRRMLSTATSLFTPIRHCGSVNKSGEEMMLIHVIQDASDTHDQRLMIQDFIRHFRTRLSAAELPIFDLMVDGVNKPRFVSQEIHGHRRQQVCKSISKHMIAIKAKFRESWREIYGKRV
jgi:hypothetical protein